MRFVYFVSALFAILYGLDLLLLLVFNRSWWRRGWLRCAVVWTPLVAGVSAAVWALGAHLDVAWITTIGAGSLSTLFVYLFALLVALLLTSPTRALVGLYDLSRQLLSRQLRPCQLLSVRSRWFSSPTDRGKGSEATDAGVLDPASPTGSEALAGNWVASPDRRRFLQTALAAVPALTAAGATSGLIGATSRPRIRTIELVYANLPASLEGLKIFHLSDIHIGPYIDLADLEELVERGTQLRPDLVLVTGDICDHLPAYLDSLRIIEALTPPLGVFACLGNHEYFRGIRAVRASFERTTIPLLVDEGITVRVGDTSLHIGGADDPQRMAGPQSYRRLRRSVEASQLDAPSDAFRVLMSHRSLALDYAAPLGVDLILAGHNHGVQLGVGGRSLFETWYPDRYLWGHYQKERSQLYTSAGVGHWFPFRLGCPPEAPLLVLKSA
jgi:predicted MPP superfamily phosphohydrolase